MTTDPERYTLRAPVLPGVLIDEEPEPRRPRWRTAALWALRGGMVAAGAAIMYAEGQVQPTPGVGFAIALALIMGAALLGSRSDG